MRLYEVIWKLRFIEKISVKHRFTTDEVEEIFIRQVSFSSCAKRSRQGEDLYSAYGQTAGGRYLIVFFIRKGQTAALPISARDMNDSERRYYERQTEAS